MATITIKGGKSFEVTDGTRLVLALEDNGIDILHRCGGNARCTTCRVKFHEGEPEVMTEAEYLRLEGEEDLRGIVRLSCQVPCAGEMEVEPLKLLSQSDVNDAGPRPADAITPDPIWMDAPKG